VIREAQGVRKRPAFRLPLLRPLEIDFLPQKNALRRPMIRQKRQAATGSLKKNRKRLLVGQHNQRSDQADHCDNDGKKHDIAEPIVRLHASEAIGGSTRFMLQH